MANTFSAVLPLQLGDVLTGAVKGLNDAQIGGVIHWYNGFVSPFFDQLTKAGMDPAAAAAIVLSEGMPKPGAVQSFELELVGSASAIIQQHTDRTISASLGFTAAMVTLGGGYAQGDKTDSSQASQQAATLKLQVGPANTAEFTSRLLDALAKGQLSALPPLLPIPDAPAAVK